TAVAPVPEPEAEHHTDIILLGSSEPSELSSPASPGPSRELIAYEVKVNERNIEDICICCGSFQVHTQHPLFEGGMCAPCKDKFLGRLFLYDDDGYQSYCSVCCSGDTLLICENPDCTREPVRVLSLFGDIRNELTSLGFLEPGSDPGRLKHLEDATDVVRKDVEGWGPFDLVYGSTPPVGHVGDHPPGKRPRSARPSPSRPLPFQGPLGSRQPADPVTIQDICGRTIQNVNAVHVWSNIPAVRSKHSALVSQEALSSLAQDRRRMKPPAQGPAKLVKNCFLPLREYFKCFSTGLTSSL
uniref:DNA methyltransferase 3 like n=1 Tax=Panthera tigris altaica TaxID=74533 RepID=A0A8C9JHI9_PANTA